MEVSGRARMRWGDRLEFVAEAGPGDFIYVPPYVPHQEINASDEQPLSVRDDRRALLPTASAKLSFRHPVDFPMAFRRPENAFRRRLPAY